MYLFASFYTVYTLRTAGQAFQQEQSSIWKLALPKLLLLDLIIPKGLIS